LVPSVKYVDPGSRSFKQGRIILKENQIHIRFFFAMNIRLFYVLDKYNIIIVIITLHLNITLQFGV